MLDKAEQLSEKPADTRVYRDSRRQGILRQHIYEVFSNMNDGWQGADWERRKCRSLP